MSNELKELKMEADRFMVDSGHMLANVSREITLDDFNKYFRAWLMLNLSDDDVKIVSEAYLNFSGGTTAGVNIIDDGKIVAYIPPLLDTSTIRLDTSGVATLYAIRELEARNLPAQATVNLNKNLTEYIEDTVGVTGDDGWDTFRKWLHSDTSETAVDAPVFDRRSMFSRG